MTSKDGLEDEGDQSRSLPGMHMFQRFEPDDTLPENYIRPEAQRPRLAEVVTGARIPAVDLGSPDRAAVVAAIGDACRSHGFFQVLNHGIHADLIASVMAVGGDFFRLPPEEKAKLYSDDPARKIRLSTSFNLRKETLLNWRDYLWLPRHPLHKFLPDWPSNPPDFNVDGGRPLNSSGSIEERGDSKIFVLSEQQPLASLVLVLWLDSGATHHAVGDARILCNLRDPPAGTAVRAADGVRLLVHKIGDIHTQYIKIQDVYLVPGLQENLISVRQLAKHKIVTTFYENYAELCLEGKQVGGAIADSVTSLYRLRYLTTPTGDPEAGTRYIREEAMDVATARGATSRSSFMQLLLSLSTSTSTKSKQPQRCLKQRDNVFQCRRTCGRCFTTFQALGGHRTSHTRRHRVHADDLDLLGARSGKGAAQRVHRSYFTGEVFPAVQALSRHRAAFHVADGDSRWPFSIAEYRDGPWQTTARRAWLTARDGISPATTNVVPSVERGDRIVHRVTSYPACPMCLLYK
ncbi:uncharacterized protein [Miscanthus floridulus]|uniref:uncharacterized protein isoform X2 n=1 Tax=Miscanthus floridulus TaxID=154761 RepID=UPI003457E10C